MINIGSPAACNKHEVQKFIGSMLSDPLLLGKSEWMCNFLAKRIIAPLSARKSLNKYRQIWQNEKTSDSPLLHHSRQLAQKLEEKKGIPVEIAMRYSDPSIEEAFSRLEKKCPLLHEVVVLPMFPHYAQSTVQSVVDAIGRYFYKRAHSYRLKIVEPYYNHPAYINALAAMAKPYLEDIDRLVFSYHSLPIQQVVSGWEKGRDFDYVYQLKETNRLFCDKLNIDAHNTLLFYVSQRGNGWLKPFLDTDIADLPKLGWKKVAVISPGFSVDNLESLYDVDIHARKLFMNAGGEKFTFIPALNDSDVWVDAVWKIIEGK